MMGGLYLALSFFTIDDVMLTDGSSSGVCMYPSCITQTHIHTYNLYGIQFIYTFINHPKRPSLYYKA